MHLEDGWLVQVWLGYQQSLRPTHAGLSLNVDIAATAFLEVQPVINFLARSAGLREARDFLRGISPVQLKKANKAIAGIMVSLFSRHSVLKPQTG
jgi:eukaryotic translation initiation factor 2C